MTVAIDAVSNFTASQNAVTSFTNASFTVGAGANRALVVALVCEASVGNSPTAPTVRWDSTGTNQSMTLIATLIDNRHTVESRIFLFGLIAPTSGNKTLAVGGLNAAVDSIVAYISFTGVNQIGGAAATFINAITALDSGITIETATITTTAGDAVLAMFNSGGAGSMTFNRTAWAVSAVTTFAQNHYAGNYDLSIGTSDAIIMTQTPTSTCGFVAMNIAQLQVLLPQMCL